MNETRTMVMTILTQYRETQRRIEVLRYEMAHPSDISAEDMIEALAFGHGEHYGSAPGYISDKTLYIALNYRDKMQQANEGSQNEIAVQLSRLEKQQERLLHYIGLMDEHDAAVIRMTYMDGLDNDQIATKLGVSMRTVRSRRMKAIDLLCGMYEYTTSFKPNVTSA